MSVQTLTKKSEFNKVLSLASRLSAFDRARLIDGVYESFSDQSFSKRIELWAKEAEERIQAHEDGEMNSVPADEVYKNIELNQ